MKGTITLAAPAKINLFLKVIGRRRDGYHNIVTIFEKIGLYDTVTLKKAPEGISLHCDTEGLPHGEGNTAHKAAGLMKKKFGIRSGVHISIKKRIPVAAGLGGGSSDAASVISGLNKIWGINASLEALIAVAAEIGSDVPFFLHDTHFALGLGRGDKIMPIKTGRKFWHVIAKPSFSISSKEAYDIVRPARGDRMMPFLLKGSTPDYFDKIMYNDLEKEIINRYPAIGRLKSLIKSIGGRESLMSGSGSCVFTTFNTREEASGLIEGLKGRDVKVFLARTN